MKSFVVAALLGVAVAVDKIGEAPIIYAKHPYPNPPYNGTQYNATVIRGVHLNSSNEWPCLTAETYFTIPPPCTEECLRKTFANDNLCEADDFTCHCSADGSAQLDKTIIPCLVEAIGAGTCTPAEVSSLANFVHGGLCPYFMANTHEQAYSYCDSYGGGYDSGYGGSHPAPASSKPAPPAPSSYKPWPQPSSKPWVKPSSKPAPPCTTSVQPTWTKDCPEPTTFWYGTKTWTVTKATIITVTDCPLTWTSPIDQPGTWATVEWTPEASPTWAYSTPAGGYAQGTQAYTAKAVEFTGAASSNQVAGAVAAIAAGAALML